MVSVLDDLETSAEQFEDAVFQDGALSVKDKHLCGVVAASMARDRSTLQEQIKAAKDAGADEDDLSGALSAAWMTAGSTQLYWANDLFEEGIEHAWYKRRLKDATKAYGTFHDAIMEDGPLSEQFMEILSMIVGTMDRCKHCTEAHIKQALNKGATKDQLAEALGVAWYVGGRSQVAWAEDLLEDA